MSIIVQLILLLRIVAQTQDNSFFFSLLSMMWFNNFIKLFLSSFSPSSYSPFLCGVGVR